MMAQEFRSELMKLTEGSGRSVSASKIQSLTKIAIRNLEEAGEIMNALEQFCASCESYYKLHALYVIDSICKASKTKLLDKDPYYPVVSKRLVNIFESLVHYAPKDADKIRHVLDIWREKEMFSNDILDKIDRLIQSNAVIRSIREDRANLGNSSKPARNEEYEHGDGTYTKSKDMAKLHSDMPTFDYGDEEEEIDEDERHRLAELQKRIIEVGSKAAMDTVASSTLQSSRGNESNGSYIYPNALQTGLSARPPASGAPHQIVTMYSRTVCLDNISAGFTEQQLRDLCAYYGPLDQFNYLPEKHRVFVKYLMRSSADNAKLALMGYEVFGMTVKTRWVCPLGNSRYFDFSTGILSIPKNSLRPIEWELLRTCENTGYVCEEPHRSASSSIVSQ